MTIRSAIQTLLSLVTCSASGTRQNMFVSLFKIDIAQLHDEHVLRSGLQSRKWQLIGIIS